MSDLQRSYSDMRAFKSAVAVYDGGVQIDINSQLMKPGTQPPINYTFEGKMSPSAGPVSTSDERVT